VEARHRSSILALAQRQAPAEADPEVARVLSLVATHGGDLLMGLDELGLPAPVQARSAAGVEQARNLAERRLEALLECVSERLMGRPEIAGQLEKHRASVLEAMAGKAVATGEIAQASRILGEVLGDGSKNGTAVGTLLFLYNLPIGFVVANPFAHITRVDDWNAVDTAADEADPEPESTESTRLEVISTSREQILSVARSQMPLEDDEAVVTAMEALLAHNGDAEMALRDLGGAPEFFGRGRFMEALVDQTFQALLGKEELIERLEAQRRSVAGNVVAGGITAAATLLSTASGIQVAIAAVVFLYLIPIGVRAAFDTWKERREA
jgi:hypothetical protein